MANNRGNNQFTKNNTIDMSDLNKEDFTKREWKVEYQRRYNQTEKAQDGRRKFAQSEFGKEWKLAYNRAYIKTEKGKACMRKHWQTEGFKARQRAKWQTEAFKARQRKWSQSKKGKAYSKAYKEKYRQSEHGKALINNISQKRTAQKLNATVSWSDQEKIKKLFHQAQHKTTQTGKAYSVDHIVPLQGKSVCGLHVEGNLRVILTNTNIKKFNQFTPATEQLVQRLMARDQIKNNVATYAGITLQTIGPVG
jgi:hypothetical protein